MQRLCKGSLLLLRAVEGGCVTRMEAVAMSRGHLRVPGAASACAPWEIHLHFCVEWVSKHSVNFLPLNTVQSCTALMVTQ